jgi:hypothetical protein
MSDATHVRSTSSAEANAISNDLITWSAIAAIVTFTIGWLAINGAVWWSSTNAAIWTSDIWSRANSQHPLDPYTLTHTMHGVLCFWMTSLLAKRLPLSRQFFLAVIFACGWELLENSSIFIERFRVVTAASEYVGDALVNSVTDIAACCFGFYLASRMKYAASISLFFAVELITAIWVRDNMALNVLMIVFPVDSVRHWQIGV